MRAATRTSNGANCGRFEILETFHEERGTVTYIFAIFELIICSKELQKVSLTFHHEHFIDSTRRIANFICTQCSSVVRV